jgi:hypothetical protein
LYIPSAIHLEAQAFWLNGAELSGEPTLLVLPHDGYSPLVPPFLLGPTDAWHNVGGLNFFLITLQIQKQQRTAWQSCHNFTRLFDETKLTFLPICRHNESSILKEKLAKL